MSKNFEKRLEKLPLPHVTTPSSQRALKGFLTSQYADSLMIDHTHTKGGEFISMLKHIGVARGVLLTLVVVIGIGIFAGLQNNNPFATKPASAQELMDKVIKIAEDFTPQEREQIEKKLKDDLEKSLVEARNAKDLTIVPESEIIRGEPDKPAKGFFIKKVEKGSDFTAAKPMVPEDITMLRYTDPEGREVTLGIDKDNKPVFKMIKLSEQDVKEGRVMQIQPEKVQEYKDVMFEYKTDGE